MLGLVQSNVDLGLCVMITVNLAGFIQAAGLRIQHHQHLHVKMGPAQPGVADTVDTTRRETLARMGHDVRTPPSGILGMAEILEDTPLTPNQKDCVGGIPMPARACSRSSTMCWNTRCPTRAPTSTARPWTPTSC